MIDWKMVRRIAGSVAGESPGTRFADADLGPLARDAQERIVAYTGLQPRSSLPAPELVSRHGWIDANITTMRPVFETLEERLQKSMPLGGPLGRVTQATSGAILAVQLGGLMGYLSQRVLGQYDMPLLDPGGEPRLLLVVPNLLNTAQRLEADRDDLLRWVVLHEVTHAVQFGSVPWLRAYLASGLRELLDSLELRVGGGQSMRLPSSDALREMIEHVRGGEFVTLVIGRDRRAIVDRMQGAMAVVEGHAEHVMDVVGASIIPTQGELRAAMEARRATRSTPLRLLEKLLGIELKMRQYRDGKRFCDVVVRSGGIATLNRVWDSEHSLPTQAELAEPARWLSRTGIAVIASGTRSGA